MREMAPAAGKRQYGVDLIKCFMALIVLLQHTRPWADLADPPLAELRSVMVAVAVAYFFVCSGYYLLREGERLSDAEFLLRLDGKLKRLCRLYFLWVAIYFPITLYGELVVYRSGLLKGAVNVFTGVFLRGQNYNSWPLWYLLAMVVSFWLIREMGKRGCSIAQIAGCSAAFFAVGLVLDTCYARSDNSVLRMFYMVLGTKNGLFYGWCFIMLGVCLRRIKIAGFWRYLALFGAATAAACVLYDYTGIAGIAVLMASAAAFLFAQNLKTGEFPGCRHADMVSKVIYFTHMLFCTLFEVVLNSGASRFHASVCVLTLLCSVLTAAWVSRSGQRRPWVKKLFQ